MPLPSKGAIESPDARAAELAARGRRFGQGERLGRIPKRDPGWKRPSRRRVLAIRDRLREMYGRPVNEPHGHPIAELVRTILSQNTNDNNRDVAYGRMRERFPTWEEVRDADPDEQQRRVAAQAQELSIGLSTPVTTMDPHFHNLTPNNSIAKHIFETLVHQDDQQTLRPGLAESWKALDDSTWEIRLRRNVRWHDGTPFTAEDVLATLKRIPNVPNSPASFAIYTRPITDAKARDPHTIVLTTRAPHPLLPNDLATIHIIPAKMAGMGTPDYNSGKAVIGTGPYRFAEYVSGDRVVLVANVEPVVTSSGAAMLVALRSLGPGTTIICSATCWPGAAGIGRGANGSIMGRWNGGQRLSGSMRP